MNQSHFVIRIDQLQPSQPFLSRDRLNNILSNTSFLLRPVAVIELNGRFCLLEGHERCYALASVGIEEVEAYIDTSLCKSNWRKCVEYTMSQGVACVDDFDNRIVDAAIFKQIWVQKKKLYCPE